MKLFEFHTFLVIVLSRKLISEPAVPVEDGLVLHIVVDVHIIEKIWTDYIVINTVAIHVSYVLAFTHKVRPIIIEITCDRASRDTLLILGLVIVWTDSDLFVFSAEENVKGGEDCACCKWKVLLDVVVSKPPDNFPAIDFKSTFVIFVSKFVVFDCWVVKAEFQCILLIEAKDFSAISLSVFFVTTCMEVSKETIPV